MFKRTSFVAFGCALLLGAGTAFADRAPNPEERAAIKQVSARSLVHQLEQDRV